MYVPVGDVDIKCSRLNFVYDENKMIELNEIKSDRKDTTHTNTRTITKSIADTFNRYIKMCPSQRTHWIKPASFSVTNYYNSIYI